MSEVEKLKIGNTSYTVRDANTLRSLTSTQATQLLANGTYNGEIVEDGEVFTNTSGKFQLFGDAQAISGSSVGVTNPTSSYGRSIACDGNDTIVYVEQATGDFGYTTDGGSTWSSGSMPTTTNVAWRTIVYGNGLFVAFGNGACAYSTDGYTWSLGTGISSTTVLCNGCYDEVLGLYVGVGFSNASSPTEGIAVTSSDGINWNEYSLPGDTIFAAVASSGGLIVVPGQNGKSYWSADGETWNLETTSNLTSDHSTPIWNGSEFVFVEKTTLKTVTSTDGITWTKTTNDLPSGDYITLSYGKEGRYKYYLVEKASSASSSNTYISLDALHWVKVTSSPSSWFGCSAVFNTKDNKFYACGTSKLQVITPAIAHTYSLTDESLTKTEANNSFLNNTGNSSYSNLGIIGTTNASSGRSRQVAIGYGAKTNNSDSVAIGYNANSGSNTQAVAIGSGASSASAGIAIGYSSSVTNSGGIAMNGKTSNGIAIGTETTSTSTGAQAVAIGGNATGTYAVTLGKSTSASATSAVSLGYLAKTSAAYAIQLGYGTNSTANTFSVGLSNSNNYQLLDSAGKIPGGRMSLSGAAAPDTSTVGSVGQFYVDTTNDDAYICVDDTSSTYTWKKITS